MTDTSRVRDHAEDARSALEILLEDLRSVTSERDTNAREITELRVAIRQAFAAATLDEDQPAERLLRVTGILIETLRG